MNFAGNSTVRPYAFAIRQASQNQVRFGANTHLAAPLGVRFGEGDHDNSVEKAHQKNLRARAADWFKAPQWLKEWRIAGEKITTGFFKLLPKSFFRWIEQKTLYLGSNLSDSKITLKEMQSLANSLDNSKTKAIINAFTEHFIDPSGLNATAWYSAAKEGKPTLLVSMGNTGSLKNMPDYYMPLLKQGYGMLMYEYPGYGHTKGTPNEENICNLAEKASEYLKSHLGISFNNHVLYGISLGGAVTVELARRKALKNEPYKAIILESTMTSFAKVTEHAIAQWLPAWLFPLHKFVQSQFKSLEKMPLIKQPLLIMHGLQDPLMPKAMGLDLFENAGTEKKSKKHVPLPGFHNLQSHDTSKEILKFLNKLK